MTNVFYRNPASIYPLAQRAEGVYLYDQHGRRYLDASGGAAVSCLGHSHPRVARAARTFLRRSVEADPVRWPVSWL